ncbi:MAG: response regulator transcription factor [Bryobacteraceae bacterium]|nr:response regulator transcription factor [Bryobacteraceae bacterium]
MKSMPEDGGRVLMVDDDRELVSLIGEFLESCGFQVEAAHDGPSGLAAAAGGGHDLVLLDVMMPGFDGFEVLRRLRAVSSVPVLMLTARTESRDRVHGLDAGADDYLPKPFEPLELAARMRAILRRTVRVGAGTKIEIGAVVLDGGSRSVAVEGRPVEVTSIEYDILETLMRAAGRVVSRDELMRRLYQREATPFDRSIDVHISHLRKKLEAPQEMIRTIRGVGYQFATTPAAAGEA